MFPCLDPAKNTMARVIQKQPKNTMHFKMSSQFFWSDTKSCVSIGTSPEPSLLISSTTDLLLPPGNSLFSYCFSIRNTSIWRQVHISRKKSNISLWTWLRKFGSGNHNISWSRFNVLDFHGKSEKRDFHYWQTIFFFKNTNQLTNTQQRRYIYGNYVLNNNEDDNKRLKYWPNTIFCLSGRSKQYA